MSADLFGPLRGLLIHEAVAALNDKVAEPILAAGNGLSDTVGVFAVVAKDTSIVAASDGVSVGLVPQAKLSDLKLMTRTISGGDISAGHYDFVPGFTATKFIVQVLTSTGALRAFTDTATINAGNVRLSLAGGASPNVQSGDIVTAWIST